MRRITVHVGGIGLCCQQCCWRHQLRSVTKGGRCGAGLSPLIPRGAHARSGECGIVEHRVRVIESPIRDADQHVTPRVGLRQIDAALHAVSMRGLHQPIQGGHHLAGQFHISEARDVVHRVQVIRVHTEGQDVPLACADPHHVRIHGSRIKASVHLGQEAHHALSAHHRRRVVTLRLLRQLARIGQTAGQGL